MRFIIQMFRVLWPEFLLILALGFVAGLATVKVGRAVHSPPLASVESRN